MAPETLDCGRRWTWTWTWIAIVSLALAACGGPAPTGTPPATASVTRPAELTIPAELRGATLAYVSGNASSADIYIALADGSNVQRLTSGAGM